MLTTGTDTTLRNRRMADILGRQHGAISRRQLKSCGFTDSMIARWLHDGRLYRIGRGVFSIVPDPDYRARLIAATLESAGNAVATSRASAHLRGYRVRGIPQLIVTSRTGRSRGDAQLVRTNWLPDEHVGVVDGIPATIPSRTLVDLGEHATAYELANAMHEAEFRDELDIDEMTTIAERLANRMGARRVGRALQLHHEGSAGTMSRSEDRGILLLEQAKVPEPWVNKVVDGRRENHRLDMYWPLQGRFRGLNVEIDGRHDRSRTRLSDEERDEDLARADTVIVRIDSGFVWRRPARFVWLVTDALRRAGSGTWSGDVVERYV